jgi:hypothetical protein
MLAVMVVWDVLSFFRFGYHRGSTAGPAVTQLRGAPISSVSAVADPNNVLGTAVVEEAYGEFYKGAVITILVGNMYSPKMRAVASCDA